jgi:phage gpG-like protein
MARFGVSGQDGLERIRGRLNAWVDRTGPGVRGELYRDAGGYMVNSVIPMRFRQHGPGWPPVARGGSPLIDTGILRDSNDWRVEGDKLLIGNTRPQARLQNRGGTIVPKTAKFLAIPQSPPLSITQARMNKPRDFPGAFVLMKGPAGPGLYRKTGAFRGKVHGIEKIFAFVKKVTIKQRKFLFWGDAALTEIRARWKRRLMGQSAAA